MENIKHLKLDEFLEKLASTDFPSPASGSAVAAVAAMSAALLEMSCKVTIKKGVEDVPISIHTIEENLQQCLIIGTEDIEALADVIRKTKSKKEFPGEYEEAMKHATDTLVSLVEKCELILTQIEKFIHSSNKKVLGELACSAYLAEAAAVSAKIGVESNLILLRDEPYKKKVLAHIRECSRNCVEIRNRIIGIIGI